jgi:CubicO group peptidase (beta-lactamase class C family)
MLLRSFAAIAALTLAAAVPASAADRLDAILASAMAGSKVPAMGAVVLRDGKVSELAVRGKRRSDARDLVNANDVWLIGSTGKVMTVALIARLVEQHELDWETPLEKLLPELAETMQPAYRKVTLLQLLSHQSGLPRDLKDASALDPYFVDTRPTSVQRLELIAKALQDAPEQAPDTPFSYSNTGFLVAAAIAERVTGSSYEALMEKEVFAPLGMLHVGFGNTGAGQNRGHAHGKPTLMMRGNDDGAPNMYAPAGFLHMPLAAWARFNLDQLAGAKGQGKLLSPASYQLMQTAQPGSPAGLDWGVQPTIAGRQGPALVHQGSDGNWLAIVALFPERGTGALVVANAAEDMGADQVLHKAFVKLFPTLSPAAGAAPAPKKH